jgi:uncharacterized protein with HEPN domain
MRGRLIHGYFGVSYLTVWDTVRNRIPGLLDTVERMPQEITE